MTRRRRNKQPKSTATQRWKELRTEMAVFGFMLFAAYLIVSGRWSVDGGMAWILGVLPIYYMHREQHKRWKQEDKQWETGDEQEDEYEPVEE